MFATYCIVNEIVVQLKWSRTIVIRFHFFRSITII